MTFIDKIKALFSVKKALDQIQAGPKSSFLTGEFWAKIAAAVCTLWAGVAGFVPHPVDIYITVGLAILISLERIYLKSRHMDTLVDLSNAPSFDPNQLTQSLNDLIAKFPKLGTVVAVPTIVKEAQDVVNKSNAPDTPAAS